jgi:hypothetical protein
MMPLVDNMDSDDDEEEEITGVHINDDVEDGVPGVPQVDDMDAKYGARSGKHNLRACKPRSYSHLHSITAQTGPEESKVTEGETLATEQMSMKCGLKVFGQMVLMLLDQKSTSCMSEQ